MKKYWYQLTEWMFPWELKPYVEPFLKYNEMKEMTLEYKGKKVAIFTTGKYIDRDYSYRRGDEKV